MLLAAASPARAQSPAVSSPLQPKGSAVIHLDATDDVTLERQQGSAWAVVCTAPCDQRLPLDIAYRLSGSAPMPMCMSCTGGNSIFVPSAHVPPAETATELSEASTQFGAKRRPKRSGTASERRSCLSPMDAELSIMKRRSILSIAAWRTPPIPPTVGELLLIPRGVVQPDATTTTTPAQNRRRFPMVEPEHLVCQQRARCGSDGNLRGGPSRTLCGGTSARAGNARIIEVTIAIPSGQQLAARIH